MNLKDKRVLVTGADGFIGSRLTEMLVRETGHVRAMTLYNSFGKRGWLEESDCISDVEIIAGDVRDGSFMEMAMKNMDVVFHLAALIAIPYSYIAPASYMQTNAMGTFNVVQAALRNEVSRVLHTSTSEVYGTARTVPIDESHILQPQSPYSASKIAADMLALSYYYTYDLPVTIVRPFNTYGPRQSARAVIPTLITQIASGVNPIKLGSLHPTRDFNFVDDTCRGFIELAGADAVGEVFNVGSNSEISIGDLAGLIKEVMGALDVEIARENERIRPGKSEVERLRCDNQKIMARTGYRPEYSLRAGLDKTVAWFRNEKNLSGYKAEIYNV